MQIITYPTTLPYTLWCDALNKSCRQINRFLYKFLPQRSQINPSLAVVVHRIKQPFVVVSNALRHLMSSPEPAHTVQVPRCATSRRILTTNVGAVVAAATTTWAKISHQFTVLLSVASDALHTKLATI